MGVNDRRSAFAGGGFGKGAESRQGAGSGRFAGKVLDEILVSLAFWTPPERKTSKGGSDSMVDVRLESDSVALVRKTLDVGLEAGGEVHQNVQRTVSGDLLLGFRSDPKRPSSFRVRL